MPLFEYEKAVYDALETNRYVWIKKATGLGITEFMLRYMAWLAFKNTKSPRMAFTIVTGPRIDLAIDLIDRLKMLFQDSGISFNDKSTVANLGSVKIEAFPSNHLDAMRGLKNVKFILLDEADFFQPKEQKNARDVSERYIGKSDARITMVSTPSYPGGLFQQMEEEQDSIYHKMFMPYTVGLGSIYDVTEIENAKRSPSFEREYNLKYGYGLGNLCSEEDLTECVKLGETYDPTAYEREGFHYSSHRSLGIDPGFGSSSYAFVLSEFVELAEGYSQVRILHAEHYRRADIEDMLNVASSLYYRCAPDRIYIDASNPEIAESLRRILGIQTQFDAYGNQKQTWNEFSENANDVQRINFAKEGATMLTNVRRIIQEHKLAINQQFKDLITELRIAKEKDSRAGALDKSIQSFDLIDALRLSCKHFTF